MLLLLYEYKWESEWDWSLVPLKPSCYVGRLCIEALLNRLHILNIASFAIYYCWYYFSCDVLLCEQIGRGVVVVVMVVNWRSHVADDCWDSALLLTVMSPLSSVPQNVLRGLCQMQLTVHTKENTPVSNKILIIKCQK